MKYFSSRKTLILAMLFVLLILVACDKTVILDYSTDETYAALFTDEDSDPAAKELKNILIHHLNAYNNGDAETYYGLFDMEKEDYQFNIAQLKSIFQTCKITNTPEAIDTAFLDENNAQAMITMTCRADDIVSGEVLYYYRTDLIYTLKRDGAWKIVGQQNTGEADLMDTLNQAE